MFFDVKDNGKPLTVAYSGGTAFNFVNTVENFDIYINSQRKMADLAKSRGATVVMSNHSEFDNAVTTASDRKMDPFFGRNPMLSQYLEHRSAKENRFPLFRRCSKTRLIPGRKPDEPSPFELGAEAVGRYFKVSEECDRVAQIKLQSAKAN